MFDPEKFRVLVRQVARSVSSKFPPFVDSEDTAQALWLFLYEKRAWILQTMEDEPQYADSKIASIMRKVAFDHCNKEKAESEGYDSADVYRYTVPKIRRLLGDVFDYEDWQSFALKSDGQPTSKGQANETGDRLAELVDVKIGLERITDDHYNVILWVYKYQYTMENIADEAGITVDAAKKRHTRALSSLQRTLGYKEPGEQPSPADRRLVRSNAAARAALSNNYEG